MSLESYKPNDFRGLKEKKHTKNILSLTSYQNLNVWFIFPIFPLPFFFTSLLVLCCSNVVMNTQKMTSLFTDDSGVMISGFVEN